MNVLFFTRYVKNIPEILRVFIIFPLLFFIQRIYSSLEWNRTTLYAGIGTVCNKLNRENKILINKFSNTVKNTILIVF